MKYILLIVCIVKLFAEDDLQLLELAYNNGLKPVPSDFVSLRSSLHLESQEFSKEKIILGKKLFFDKELSLGKDISCATCHNFEKGGTDGMSTAIGHKNQENPFHINTPTIFNTAFSKKLFWDGRSDSLQDQAKGPMQASFEMSITPQLAEERVYQHSEYIQLFTEVYGTSQVTFEKIADAISTYERTIITRGRYDDFLLGYFDALNQDEKEGLHLFITKSCVGCHNGIGLGGQVLRKFPLTYHAIWSMQKPAQVQELQKKYNAFLETQAKEELKDDEQRRSAMLSKLGEKDLNLLKEGFFHQIEENKVLKVITTSACTECHENKSNRVKETLLKEVAFPFENQGGFLGSKQNKYFRVPLLRNVVRTKPYFHNGSVAKLEDAIKIMGRHQGRVNLSDDEVKKIVTFLKAVDGKIVDYTQ